MFNLLFMCEIECVKNANCKCELAYGSKWGIKRCDREPEKEREKQTSIISSDSHHFLFYSCFCSKQTYTDLSIPLAYNHKLNTYCFLFHSVSEYYFSLLSNLPCWQKHPLYIQTHVKRKQCLHVSAKCETAESFPTIIERCLLLIKHS